MKTVVNNSEVAHLFVWGAQDHARNSSGSFSFKGDTLRSYATQVAYRFTVGKGADSRTVIVADNRYYSSTTSRQMCDLSRAIPYKDQTFLSFWIDQASKSHSSNVERLLSSLESELDTLTRCQFSSMDWKIKNILEKYKKACRYLEVFKPKVRKFEKELKSIASPLIQILYFSLVKGGYKESDMLSYILATYPRTAKGYDFAEDILGGSTLNLEKLQATKEKVTKALERRRRERQLELKKRRELERAQELKRIKGWQSFAPGSNYYRGTIDGFTWLRVNEEKNQVESSLGMHLSFRIAKVIGETFRVEPSRLHGQKVLEHFRIRETTNKDRLDIGCHSISREMVFATLDQIYKIEGGKPASLLV